jgi:hypothetical protein
MKLEIGENQGHVIIDDETGQILSVFVNNAVGNTFDGIGVANHRKIGDKHYKIQFSRDKDE